MMLKKEYFIIFALIGLSVAYVLLSFLVFITRGKWARAFHKKLAISATIVAFCAILNTGSVFAQTVDPTPDPSPMPVYGTLAPTEAPTTEPVALYAVPNLNIAFQPTSQNVKTEADFTTELHVNTMGFNLATYNFTIDYDETLIDIDTENGTGGVEEGRQGFIVSVVGYEPGSIIVQGIFEPGAIGGNDIHLCTIYWTAGSGAGSTVLDLTINEFAGLSGDQIGIPTDIDGSVTVNELLLGDVNADGKINIIDALLVAQYYVNIIPDDFIEEAADVNASGGINIIDALLIAQKYVGTIDSFPGE
jgi:hypothetical protein